jgi:hypothetical protein
VVAILSRLIHGSIREVKPSAPSSWGRWGGSIARHVHASLYLGEMCKVSIQITECIVIWDSLNDRRGIARHPRSYDSDGCRPGRENRIHVRLPHLLPLGLSAYRRTVFPDRAQPPAGPALGHCGPKQVAMNFLYTSDASLPSAGPPTGSARCSVPRSTRLRNVRSAFTAGRTSAAVAKPTGWVEGVAFAQMRSMTVTLSDGRSCPVLNLECEVNVEPDRGITPS